MRRVGLLRSSVTVQLDRLFCYCRAQSLSDMLNAQGWPATFISGSRDQQDRLAAMAQLKKLQCRILVSTDLVSIVRSVSLEEM